MGTDGRFTGRRVLVSGGSSGIGAATVQAFATAGARVVAASRRSDRLAEVSRAAPDGAVMPGAYVRRIPMRRPAAAEEQASVVLFLASEDASFVNGEAIIVDGGQLSGFWYYDEDAPPVPLLDS